MMTTAHNLTAIDGGKHAAQRGETLFERAHDVQRRFNLVEAELKAIKEEIREANPLGTHEEAGIKVRLAITKTFDKAKARELYGDAVCELVPTVDKAKEILTGAQIDALYKIGAPAVTIVVEK
jgi:hypothetical protein